MSYSVQPYVYSQYDQDYDAAVSDALTSESFIAGQLTSLVTLLSSVGVEATESQIDEIRVRLDGLANNYIGLKEIEVRIRAIAAEASAAGNSIKGYSPDEIARQAELRESAYEALRNQFTEALDHSFTQQQLLARASDVLKVASVLGEAVGPIWDTVSAVQAFSDGNEYAGLSATVSGVTGVTLGAAITTAFASSSLPTQIFVGLAFGTFTTAAGAILEHYLTKFDVLDLDELNPSDENPEGVKRLADAQALFSALDPNFLTSSMVRILDAFSGQVGNHIDSFFMNVKSLLNGAVGIQSLEELTYAIRKANFQYGKTSFHAIDLTTLSAQEIYALSARNDNTGQAVRYALVNLMPVAFTDIEGTNAVLPQYDLLHYSQSYLEDRSLMLQGYIDGNIDERVSILNVDGGLRVESNIESDEDYLAVDAERTIQVQNYSFSPDAEYMYFGSDDGESVEGLSEDGVHRLYGMGGDDVVSGGQGQDYLEGNTGNDTLNGNDGIDKLYGNSGNDTLTGGKDDDYLDGGTGNDTYIYNTGDGRDTIVDHEGGNVLQINGQSNFTITQITEGENVYQDAAKNTYTYNEFTSTLVVALKDDPDGGVIWIEGFDATENNFGITLQSAEAHEAPTANEDAFVVGDGKYAPDGTDVGLIDQHFIDREHNEHLYDVNHTSLIFDAAIYGGGGDPYEDADLFYFEGSALNDEMYGNEYENHLLGFGGDDYISGNGGENWLYGGSGSDTIIGGDDWDSIFGSFRDIGESWEYDPYIWSMIVDQQGDTNYLEGNGGTDFISGGEWADIILGGSDTDEIFGNSGNDSLFGDDGNDQIFGDSTHAWYLIDSSYRLRIRFVSDTDENYEYNDILFGGEGNDFLMGEMGNDTLDGGIGDDVLYGDRPTDPSDPNKLPSNFEEAQYPDTTYLLNEVFHGNDVLSGGDGTDHLFGGGGSDLLSGDGDSDYLYGENGEDTLRGGTGEDYLYGGDDADTLYGDEGIDRLHGEEGNDLLYGGEGDDILYGEEGEDRLFGDAGSDYLFGGEDSDYLSGGDDADILEGEAGDDTLIGGLGNDRLKGGADNDTYIYSIGDGIDTIEDTEGANRLVINAPKSRLMAVLSQGGSTILVFGLEGGLVNQAIRIIDPAISNMDIEFTDGLLDLATWENGELPVGDSANPPVFTEGDDIASGGYGNDELLGGGGNDYISGADGADTIYGGDGNDVLIGGVGNDNLYGGEDNDRFIAGPGSDYIDGSSGIDSLEYHNGDETVTARNIENLDIAGYTSDEVELRRFGEDVVVTFKDDPEGKILFLNGFDASGNLVLDTLNFMDSGEQAAINTDGVYLDFNDADRLIDRYGTIETTAATGRWDLHPNLNQIYGTDSGDIIYAGEGYLNTEIYGNGGDDQLFASSFQGAKLYGGGGDDYLRGAAGFDKLYGGDGSDTYVMHRDMSKDEVTDNYDYTNLEQINRVILEDGLGIDDLRVSVGSENSIEVWGIGGDYLAFNGYFDSLYTGMNVDVQILVGDEIYSLESFALDQLGATRGDDEIAATSFGNMYGLDGMDTMRGNQYNNNFYGMQGNDYLYGEEGSDFLYGGEGNDELYGGDNSDELYGGEGNDILAGGRGNDAYVYEIDSQGDSGHSPIGQDTIIETDGLGYAEFYGFEYSDVTLKKSSLDLVIDVNDSSDKVTVKNWFLGTQYQIDLYFDDDGTELFKDDINELFNYSPSNGAPIVNLGNNELDVIKGSSFELILNDSYFYDAGGIGELNIYTEFESDWLTYDSNTRMISGIVGNYDSVIRVFAENSAGIAGVDYIWLNAIDGEIETNTAPTPSIPIDDQNTAEDAEFIFELPSDAFSDADGDALVYSVDQSTLPTWLSFNGTTFTGTPTNDDVDSYDITVIASDGQASAQTTFTLTVDNVNDAPVVSMALSDYSVEVGQLDFGIPAGTFTDVDAGDTLMYSAKLADGNDLPSWLAFDATTGVFSSTQSEVGTWTVEVFASDGIADPVSTQFDLVVTEVVQAPEMNIIDGTNGNDALVGTDGNDLITGGAGQDTLNGGDGEDTLIGGVDNDTLSGGTGNDTYRFYLGDGQDKIYEGGISSDVDVLEFFDAEVSDLWFYRSNSTLRIYRLGTTDRVEVVNWFAFSKAQVEEIHVDGQTLALDGINALVDVMTTIGAPVNGNITLTAEQQLQIAEAITAAWQPNPDAGPENNNPAVDAGLTDQTTAEDAGFNFQMPSNAFSDADGDTLTYTIDENTKPAWLSFDGTTFTGTPTNDDVGSYDITVIATDGQASAQTTFTLTVDNVNDAPVVSMALSDYSVEVGQLDFGIPAGTFTDVDAGDTLMYSAKLADGNDLPSWLSFDATTGVFSSTQSEVGTWTVEVFASDGIADPVSTQFDLVVTDVNDAPGVDQGISNQTTAEDAEFNFELPPNTFSDADGDTLVYSVDQSTLPTWLSFDGMTFTGTPTNDDVGSYDITVIATDGQASAQTTFTLTVDNVNDAPVVSMALSDYSAEEGQLDFGIPAGTFTDVDAGDMLMYSAKLADGNDLPSWLAFDATTGVFSSAQSEVGTWTVEVFASDGIADPVSTQFDLVVTEVVQAPEMNVIDGTNGNDTLVGTDGNDLIIGGEGFDIMSGGAGDDIFKITGLNDGKDTITGGEGYDGIVGSEGDDAIILTGLNAESSVEYIDGEAGFNRIEGTFYGDTLDFSATTLLNIAEIDGGNKDDTIIGSQGDDVIIGGVGNDTLIGGAGNDIFKVTGLDEGKDSFTGGDGIDRILGSAGDDTIGLREFNQVTGVEIIDGGAGFNRIEGSYYSDTLDFSATTLLNIAEIDGGNKDDTIIGSQGNDVIIGGVGNDTLIGGAGDDIFKVTGLDEGKDSFTGGDGIDRILGSAGDDAIGLREFNQVTGVEIIDGGAGFNRIEGTIYGDTLDFSSTTLLNIAEIDGGNKDDTIIGSQGNDVIIGGANNDYLSGGLGSDNYVIWNGEGTDTIFDNGVAGETDRISFMEANVNDLWFSRDNSDLLIYNLGQGNTLRVDEWYNQVGSVIEEIHAEGQVLYQDQLESLVTAMATFGTPSGGDMTLTESEQQEVNNAIAASWQTAV